MGFLPETPAIDLGAVGRILADAPRDGYDAVDLVDATRVRAAHGLLLTTHLLPHVPFDADRFVDAMWLVTRGAQMTPLSPVNGEGLGGWCGRAREQADSSTLCRLGAEVRTKEPSCW